MSDSATEVDCLSVRESALCGCIPLLSTKAVFPERAGLHIPGDPQDPKVLKEVAHHCLQLIQLDDTQLDSLRQLLRSQTIAEPWSVVAGRMANEFTDMCAPSQEG